MLKKILRGDKYMKFKVINLFSNQHNAPGFTTPSHSEHLGMSSLNILSKKIKLKLRLLVLNSLQLRRHKNCSLSTRWLIYEHFMGHINLKIKFL